MVDDRKLVKLIEEEAKLLPKKPTQKLINSSQWNDLKREQTKVNKTRQVVASFTFLFHLSSQFKTLPVLTLIPTISCLKKA